MVRVVQFFLNDRLAIEMHPSLARGAPLSTDYYSTYALDTYGNEYSFLNMSLLSSTYKQYLESHSTSDASNL